MDFHISLVGRKNLGREIYRQVRAAIVEGRLRQGDPLPPTRELARRLGVARNTVTVAYDRLSGEGFVASRVGSGTFVSRDAVLRKPAPVRNARPGPLKPRPLWLAPTLPAPFGRTATWDFRAGVPDSLLFPYRAWRRLSARALRAEAGMRVVPGPAAGFPPLREAIARHLAISRGVVAEANHVTVTNGTQQALDILGRVLLEPGDTVAVEDPGYSPARRLFESHGLRVVGVPVDREGLVIDALPRRTRLVYVTPSHQYPLGMAMTLPRRLALLAWADRHGAAIIEDDYDSEFRFEGRPIEPLQLLDQTGRVIYVGSFSKSLLPSLRLGFLISPPSLTLAVHRAKHFMDWSSPQWTQRVLAGFLDEGGFARHVRRMRETYRARHQLIAHALTHELSGFLEWIPSGVGLHVTALTKRLSVAGLAAVARRASERGVEVHELANVVAANAPRAGLVIGYGAIATKDIPEGLRRLRLAFEG